MRRFNKCPSRNEDFCSRSRHAKKITAGIYLIFRGLFFEHNADIGQKDRFWMDTNKCQKGLTLIEIIVTIIVASILCVIFLQFMGTSMTGSVETVTMAQKSLAVEQVMERMTLDYRKLMAEDTDPLGALKSHIQNGNQESSDPYFGPYTVVYNDYVLFGDDDGDGFYDEESGGDKVLKVTIPEDDQKLTALFAG